jgi:lipid-A-disaccharide synthase-like uncharacterized protein
MNALWMTIGFVGQGAFASRFLAQWLASEKAGRSVVPIHFWIFSIIGAALLLVYAIRLRDPVFIVGQSAGMFIYLRNLALIRKEASGARQQEKHA